MAINKKFIRFKNYENYIAARDSGQILPKSIVFVAEAKTIYLNGEEFSTNTLYNLQELLENTNTFELENTDSTNQAIIKLYKALNSAVEDFNKTIGNEVSNITGIIKTIILSISDIEETLAKEIADNAEITAAGLTNLNKEIQDLKNNVTSIKVESLTQEEFNALENKDPNTIYLVS